MPTRNLPTVSHEFCRAPLHPGPCKGWKAALEAGRDHTVTHHDLIPGPKRKRARKAAVPSAPSAAAEPDGVELARKRQAEIDHLRARAEVLAEADEWIANQGTQKSRARALEQLARHHNVDGSPDIAGVLVAAHALDTPHLRTAIAKAAAKLGLTKTADAGDIVPFNGREQRHLGGAPQRGTMVHVARPGYLAKLSNGETVPVVKAVVEEATPDEISAHRSALREPGQTASAAALECAREISHEFCRAPLHPGPCKGWKGAVDVVDSVKIPRARKAPTPARALRGLSDDDLADRFAEISRADTLDEPALRDVISEMDRREKGTKRPYKRTREQEGVDAGIADGRDYKTAAADWIGRRKGESTDQAIRRYHDEWLDLSYLQAEQATRGHMLSPAGRAARIDPRELFTGTTARARKYASEELQRWWVDHPRVNRTQFRAQLLGRLADVKAARGTKAQSTGRDFI